MARTEHILKAGIEASRADASDHVAGHMYGWARKDDNDVWYQDIAREREP
jgi:hypothetical protein